LTDYKGEGFKGAEATGAAPKESETVIGTSRSFDESS